MVFGTLHLHGGEIKIRVTVDGPRSGNTGFSITIYVASLNLYIARIGSRSAGGLNACINLYIHIGISADADCPQINSSLSFGINGPVGPLRSRRKSYTERKDKGGRNGYSVTNDVHTIICVIKFIIAIF